MGTVFENVLKITVSPGKSRGFFYARKVHRFRAAFFFDITAEKESCKEKHGGHRTTYYSNLMQS